MSAPLLRLHDYIRQHSDLALRSDPEDALERRRYAVAYYSCPHQAGNRLHHLFNSVLWSIVLNRTVLVHYYTREACEAAGAGYDSGICRHANRQRDCDPVLRRHSWVPMYDEWKDRLGLPRITQRQLQKPMHSTDVEVNGRPTLFNGSVILHLDYWSTRGPSGTSSRNPWRSNYQAYLKIDSRLAGVKIVDFPQMLGQDARLLIRPGNREQILATDEARDRARDLLSLGPDYLYGMLFRHMFEFQPLVAPPPMAAPGNGGETPEEDEKPRPVVVIGVHSRHANQHDDGSNIRGESDCIESLLDEHRQHSECRLVLMSDRPLTLVKLREQASRDWNCSVVTAHEPAARATNRAGADSSPPSATSSWLSEHGPYSGIGFYQDWALMVSHAHAMRGFVGRKRSSSLLVREVVEYDRMRHHQFIGSDGAEEAPSSAKPLTNCLLPY